MADAGHKVTVYFSESSHRQEFVHDALRPGAAAIGVWCLTVMKMLRPDRRHAHEEGLSLA